LHFGEGTPEEAEKPAAPGDSFPEARRRIIKIAWDSGRGDLWPWLQQQLECELIRFGLEQTVPKLSQVQLAKRLGIARNTLRARIEQHQLQNPDLCNE
jgi:hypothetical protein